MPKRKPKTKFVTSKTYKLYVANSQGSTNSILEDKIAVKEVIKGTLNLKKSASKSTKTHEKLSKHSQLFEKDDHSSEEDHLKEDYNCDVQLLYPCDDEDFISKWQKSNKGGTHKILFDNDININVWEIKGRATASVYAHIPKNSLSSLHMKLPVVFLLFKYTAQTFFFEIKILDNHQFYRRFRFSSFHKSVCIDIFSTKIPVVLFKGWNILQINLARLTKAVYRTDLMETKSIEVHANVRIGRIAFISRQLNDNEIPTNNTWFSPKRNNPSYGPGIMSIYSQQSGQVIDYSNIYEPTF